MPTDPGPHAAAPGLRERDAVDPLQDVEPHRLHAERDAGGILARHGEEALIGYALESEVAKGCAQIPRVRGAGIDQDVEVTGVTRSPESSKRMRAYDEEPDPV